MGGKVRKICSVFLGVCLVFATVVWGNVFVKAESVEWKLAQSVSTGNCKPGDVINITVALSNSGGQNVDITRVAGVIDYDRSLFSVEKISCGGSGASQGTDTNGAFSLSGGAFTYSSGQPLVQISLKTQNVSISGQSTICVNQIVIVDSQGKDTLVTNYVPSIVEIAGDAAYEEKPADAADEALLVDEEVVEDEADEAVKDENIKDKDVKEDDAKDSDSKKKNDKKKNDKKKTDKKKTTVKKKTTNKKVVVAKKTNTNNKSKKSKKLDKNYKTGVIFGNEGYFIIAGIVGVILAGLYVARKKLSGKFIL